MAIVAEEQDNEMLDAQGLMWTEIAAGIAVLLFGLSLYGLLHMRSRMKHARTWDKVAGVITASGVDQPAAHVSDDQNDATPVIRYRYRVGGRDFESDKVNVGGLAMTTRVLATRMAARYPVGARVDVYVDPATPTEALLEPAAPENFAAIVVFTTVFALIALTLTAHALTGHVLYAGNGVPLFTFVFPIVALVAGAGCIGAYVRTLRLARASLQWPKAAGTITHSDVVEEIVEEKPDEDEKSNVRKLRHRYQLDLRYAYTIGERDFVGTDINWGGTAIYGLRELAEKAASLYRPGQNVTVHYDPDHPRHAVLEPASRQGTTALLLGAALCLIVGGILGAFLIKAAFG